MKKECKAFTLAETLITLTIIGVIAALTIPNLYSKYQKQQLYAGAVKAQNIFSTWIQKELIREGCSSGDFECAPEIGIGVNSYTSAQKHWMFITYWQTGFKLTANKEFQKRFGVVEEVWPNSLKNKYKYQVYKIENGKKVVDNYGHPTKDWFINYITKDGMMWGVETSSSFMVENKQIFNAVIRVDTNGPRKGPNISGLDVVYFIMYPIDYGNYKKGVLYPLKNDSETAKRLPQCSKRNVNAGCTSKMLLEKKITYY